MKKELLVVAMLGAGACRGGCGPTSCVARGARVRVPKGTRPIEDLAPGDDIICVDPDTGQQVTAKIVATRSAKRECVRLVAADAELILTSDHPIYCPQTREWAPAGDWALRKRDQVLRISGESAVEATRVTEVFTFCGIHEVFDLTVDHPLHNFVANGVLVHNKTVVLTCDFKGQRVSSGDSCDCGGATGFIECEKPATVFCICPPDAGSPDGG